MCIRDSYYTVLACSDSPSTPHMSFDRTKQLSMLLPKVITDQVAVQHCWHAMSCLCCRLSPIRMLQPLHLWLLHLLGIA